MKFARKTETDLITKKVKTTKYYICPACGYMTVTSEFNGKIERICGEEDFILFPFTSYATLTGTTKELCACPACDSVQVIDMCDHQLIEEYIPIEQRDKYLN